MGLLRQLVLVVEVRFPVIFIAHVLSACFVCSGRELDGLGFV
jgi:hypothetical protein